MINNDNEMREAIKGIVSKLFEGTGVEVRPAEPCDCKKCSAKNCKSRKAEYNTAIHIKVAELTEVEITTFKQLEEIKATAKDLKEQSHQLMDKALKMALQLDKDIDTFWKDILVYHQLSEAEYHLNKENMTIELVERK